MFRASRTRPTAAAERYVYPKILIFVIGASLGLAGMASGIDWLVTAAIAVLALGFVIRLLTRNKAEDTRNTPD